MAILKVTRLGHPVLRLAASPVSLEELATATFQRLIDEMIETMHEYDGVGLSAPQVHVSQQVAVIEVANSPRYPQAPAVSLTVLVNPTISTRSDETQLGWEGCLSVDDLRGRVPRARRVTVQFLDRHGHEQRIEAANFFAVVLQHECDHLQGQIFLDRMADFSTLTHLKEFRRYWASEEIPPPEPMH